MTVTLFVVAAAFGAVARHGLGRVQSGWSAVLVANLAGSLALGVLVAAEIGGDVETVVGLGLCGALTTFSSFARETILLGPARGSAYAVVTIGASCACVGVPIALS